MMRRWIFVFLFWLAQINCGQGLGDECDGVGSRGQELRCVEGTCVYDRRVGASICLEDNLPDGAACIGGQQCQDKRQCYSDDPEALSGTCRPYTKLGGTCHQRSWCAEGHCYKNVCRLQQPEGGDCRIGQFKMCQGDLICDVPDGFDVPLSDKELDRLDRNEGTCRPGYAEGERCDGQLGLNCAPGLWCADFDICKKEGEY